MSQRFSSDPVTVAAAVQGAFRIMAARIDARQDSRLLVDNELVTAEAFELASLMLSKLDAGLGTLSDASPLNDDHAHSSSPI